MDRDFMNQMSSLTSFHRATQRSDYSLKTFSFFSNIFLCRPSLQFEALENSPGDCTVRVSWDSLFYSLNESLFEDWRVAKLRKLCLQEISTHRSWLLRWSSLSPRLSLGSIQNSVNLADDQILFVWWHLPSPRIEITIYFRGMARDRTFFAWHSLRTLPGFFCDWRWWRLRGSSWLAVTSLSSRLADNAPDEQLLNDHSDARVFVGRQIRNSPWKPWRSERKKLTRVSFPTSARILSYVFIEWRR